jgi:hypothetical protein
LSAKCPLFLKNVHHQKLKNKKKTIKTQETIFEVDIPARVNMKIAKSKKAKERKKRKSEKSEEAKKRKSEKSER